MTWRVRFSAAAIRSLDKLPPRIAAAVVEFTTSTLPQNPGRIGKPLSGDLDGLHSARRGEYRVLFELDHSSSTLTVVRVAHRADAYRPR